ncbi:F-box domain-containing protein [Colletotrichum asianum]
MPRDKHKDERQAVHKSSDISRFNTTDASTENQRRPTKKRKERTGVDEQPVPQAGLRSKCERSTEGSTERGRSATSKRRKIGLNQADLGLDDGSTAIRASLCVDIGDRSIFYDVRDPECPPQGANNGQDFDFPSALKPSTGQTGHDALRAGGWLSVKFLIYELVRRATDDAKVDKDVQSLLRKTFKGDLILKEKEREELTTGQLRAHVVECFRKVAKATQDTCDREGLFYDSIAVTLPRHMEHAAVPDNEAFTNITPENFVYIYEAEAVGHYLLHSRIRGILQRPEGDEKNPHRLMIADFGGHTVNGVTFHLRWNEHEKENSKPAFFATQKPWGAPGGSELYAREVEKALRKDPECTKGSQDEVEECVKGFMECLKLKQGNHDGTAVTLVCDKEPHIWQPTGPADAARLYKRAFDRPLKEVHAKITARMGRAVPTTVVLTGGSYLNAAARAATIAKIDSQPAWKYIALSEIRAVSDMRLVVAQGAALALSKATSVAEFMKQGAAFALHSPSLKGPDGLAKPNILTYKQQNWEFRFDLRTESRMRIRCEPFHQGTMEDLKDPAKRRIEVYNAYDFLDLGSRRKGSYTISLKHVRGDGKDFMILREKAEEDDRDLDGPVVHEWKLPVYVDIGQCVLMVDQDEFDLQKLKRE